MRAMVLEACAPIETEPLKWKKVETPNAGEGQIRVKVSTCGVCRTELHVIEGELSNPHLPLIPGHEIVGIVDQCGEGANRFKLGDRVGIAWLRHTCEHCTYCTAGNENLCEQSRYTGYHANGGYAEYATVDENYAYSLPDYFDDATAAPLLCAGIIGYRAYQRSRVPKKGKLGIIGFGSSAHVTAQLALDDGCEVHVATRARRHQQLALDLGAKWAGNSDRPFPTQLDSIILFTPAGPLIPLALRSVRKGGTVTSAGIHMSTIPAMQYEECLFHEKDLRSVESNTRKDGEAFLQRAAKIPIEPHVQVFPVQEANQVLQQLKNDAFEGSAVLAFNTESPPLPKPKHK